jgi:hypothetical protein
MMLDAPLAPEAEAADRDETQARLAIIDGDVHPAQRSPADLKPYMPARWWDVLAAYGTRRRHGMSFEPYPKSAPRACRRDAWPETGGPPGSDLALIRQQYLDHYGAERGQPRSRRGARVSGQRLAARHVHEAGAAPAVGSRGAL